MIKPSDISYITEGVEPHLPPLPKTVPPLCHNKWLLSSGMQKAIRRGDHHTACYLATCLYYTDPVMLWRRLPIIALEDVGLGNGEALAETLTISAAPKWRRRVGDLRAVLYIVKRLAKAVKSRSTTDLYFVAEYSPIVRDISGESNRQLKQIAEDSSAEIKTRALALWYLAGTKRYESNVLDFREGDLDAAMYVMAGTDAPYYVAQSCILHLKRSRYPLALLSPLIFEAYQDTETHIHTNPLNHTPKYNKLPLYAYDGLYTRDGKAAVKRWKHQTPALKPYNDKQIATALFYVEGGLLNEEIMSPDLEDLKSQAQDINFQNVNLDQERQYHLLEYVRDNLTDLNRVRMEN